MAKRHSQSVAPHPAPAPILQEELRRAFKDMASARESVARSTGEARGFGFVEFGSAEDAERAIQALQAVELESGNRLLIAPGSPGRSRGFAFVETEAPEDAAGELPSSELAAEASAEPAVPSWEASTHQLALELLGGAKVLGAAHIRSDEQAHAALLKGIPSRALVELVAGLESLPAEEVLGALQMSPRSYARRKASPRSKLPLDEAGRLWRFAEILAQAIIVFGTRARAEAWLAQPVMGLGRMRPIELLATPPGASLVSEHLTRLEYGVYT